MYSTASRRILRPGWVPLRRGDGIVQIGLDSKAVGVPDTAAVWDLLNALGSGGDPTAVLGPPARWPDDVRSAWARLEAAGLLAPLDDVLGALGRARLAPGMVSAVFAHDPAGGRSRLEGRRAARWHVEAAVPAADDGVTALRDLLLAQGMGHGAGRVEPDGVVVLSVGEPCREISDRLVRDDVAHLWVALLPDRIRVGPFVVPGLTACLRCRDAGLAEHDPRLLVALARACEPAAGLLPAPLDPLAVTLANAVGAREVVTYVDGERPTTWSSTVEIPATGPTTQRPLRRHPWCGCAWDAAGVGVGVG